jgi:hypothetical protein
MSLAAWALAKAQSLFLGYLAHYHRHDRLPASSWPGEHLFQMLNSVEASADHFLDTEGLADLLLHCLPQLAF